MREPMPQFRNSFSNNANGALCTRSKWDRYATEPVLGSTCNDDLIGQRSHARRRRGRNQKNRDCFESSAVARSARCRCGFQATWGGVILHWQPRLISGPVYRLFLRKMHRSQPLFRNALRSIPVARGINGRIVCLMPPGKNLPKLSKYTCGVVFAIGNGFVDDALVDTASCE